ncbi:MAG: DUF58 domain-containing protein [Nitrospiraceae bacterium]
MTSEGTRFLLFTLAVGVAAVNTGNNLFYLLLAMMLSLIVMSGLLSEQCLRRLEFGRHAPEYLFANEPTTITLEVKNCKLRLPSFSLRLVDVTEGIDLDRGAHLQYIAPRATILISYPLLLLKRGYSRLDGIRVITPFPFGLFLKKRYYPAETSIIVCPARYPLPSSLLQDLGVIGQDQHLAQRGRGLSLYNLREYRTGDDSRAIHWMTTARTSKLMIKETEAEDQRWVTLAMSPVAPPEHDSRFERALSIAGSIVQLLHSRGYHLRLVLGSESIPFGAGEEHATRILETLALCTRSNPENADDVETALTQVLRNSRDGFTVLIRPWISAGSSPLGIPIDITIDPESYRDLFDVA